MAFERPDTTMRYWATRAVHWILARMGLFQTVFLFLWLSERAQLNRTPPIQPWIIFIHATVGMIGSTGLSARFLARASLYALVAVQLHLGYLYAFQSTLGYPRWLRARVALRSMASAAIYLRILGIQKPNQPAPSSKPEYQCTTRVYTLGLSLLSVFTALTGILSLPVDLLRIDRETQLMEQSSSWPLFAFLEPVPSLVLSVGFCIASLLYAFPLLASGTAVSNYHGIEKRLFRVADLFTLSSLAAQVMFRDSHIAYWTTNGSEFWLHAHLLLNTFIVFAGVLVTMDMFEAATGHQHESSTRVKTD